MGHDAIDTDEEIKRLKAALVQLQRQDGTWRFCFENGTIIDAYVIILVRTLDIRNEDLIRRLHDRILAEQSPEGAWSLYRDEEEGNLSATVDAYYALLYSGYSGATDEPVQRAKRYILSRGGLGQATSLLTKAMLAATGQRKWPVSISSIPLELLLFPASFPINFFEFSGYSRIHLVPLLIMADRNFSVQSELAPDLHDLIVRQLDNDEQPSRGFPEMLELIKSGLNKLIGTPRHIHEAATEKAKEFMLQRIEPDGTLYTYASSTILMIYALLALGYDKRDPLIMNAVQAIMDMRCKSSSGGITIQNSPSTVWDTALLAYALQEAGAADGRADAAIRQAAGYLLANQQHKYGDWSVHNPDVKPGGWGFSETNTINPDVDDTTAALRAIKRYSRTDPAFREAWNRGLHWVLSMQNKDGGWPAFEKNTDKKFLTWLAIDGAKSAATDPSEADLTGRALEYLGGFAGLDIRQPFIKRGADWLIKHQEKNGSWYGRWGICYIYGTWAALTGLKAVGVSSGHEAVQKGAQWLLRIQNADGGWGESCRSDRMLEYIPLGESTPSQTAWALDALIAVHPQPTAAINQGVMRLIQLLHSDGWTDDYPTGAGLPGNFYIHYHSYKYIWPLLALGHYRRKYES